jgi:2-dehydro-3-deoxygalactonokinase
MGAVKKPVVVGVDWGTTHRRAYVLNAEGECAQEHSDSEGALACKDRFSDALRDLLQKMQISPDLVVMSGMVGSAFGWQEVPYVTDTVALNDLPQNLVNARNSPAGVPCVIVPGYCVRNPLGQPDVMRGEETQLLGAVATGHHSGWFVLPGTHSKWVELSQGRIVQLRTYMTGELFGLLTQQGTLAAAAGSTVQVWNSSAFCEGVEAASHGSLNHQLFGCRARVVCGDMPSASVHAYLSGLLIGSELSDVLRVTGSVDRAQIMAGFQLLGSPELAAHYQAAASQLALRMRVLDAKASFIAAMVHFQSIWRSA